MLTVTIDDENELAGGVSDAGLDGRAIPLVVGVPDDPRTSGCGHARRLVGRSIVDDEHFAPGRGLAQRLDDGADRLRLFEYGNDDADGGGITHECEIVSWCKAGAKI